MRQATQIVFLINMQAVPFCLRCPYYPLLPLPLTDWAQCI